MPSNTLVELARRGTQAPADASALDSELRPIALLHIATRPHRDLTVGEEENPISPLNWLFASAASSPIIQLATPLSSCPPIPSRHLPQLSQHWDRPCLQSGRPSHVVGRTKRLSQSWVWTVVVPIGWRGPVGPAQRPTHCPSAGPHQEAQSERAGHR